MDMNKNINNLMQEAQKMQQRMQEAQDQLGKLTVQGEAGAGTIKVQVEMNGRHEVLKVKITPGLLEEEITLIEDLLAAAVNDTVRKIEKASREKISQLTAGLNIPPEFLKDK